VRAIRINSRYQKPRTERPNSAVLRVHLFYVAYALGQHLNIYRLVVPQAIDLRLYARLIDQHSCVCYQTRSSCTNVFVHLKDFLYGRFLDYVAPHFSLGCQNHAFIDLDAKGRQTPLDRLLGVLNLE
jgi:hypothetical protein